MGGKGICMTELSIKLNKNNVLFVQAYNSLIWNPNDKDKILKKGLVIWAWLIIYAK